MSKFYITNGDGYLAISADATPIVGSPVTQARRFKYEEAQSTLLDILRTHQGYCMQKYYSSASRKNYVITNATRFIGGNGVIVKKIGGAKTFKSAAEADGYIQSHGDLIKQLGKCVIINENYETVDLSGKAKLSSENLAKINSQKEKTPRLPIPKSIKYQVFERDGGICQICGRPLTINEFTVDHVVPLGRSGVDDISNYRCVCKRCNEWKADSLDEEKVRMIEDVGANYLYNHPDSDMADKMFRAMVLGMIKDIN